MIQDAVEDFVLENTTNTQRNTWHNHTDGRTTYDLRIRYNPRCQELFIYYRCCYYTFLLRTQNNYSNYFNLLTYLRKELSPSWEAANCAAIQEIPSNFKKPEGSSPCSQDPSIGPYPEPVRSIFLCLGPLFKESVHVRGYLWIFVTR
jgi:hypothetical protein